MEVFETLNGLNVNGHTEKKDVGGKELTYLSWPWAWAEVKKSYPDAHYSIWRDGNGRPYTFDSQTGYMVFTDVTIGGITHMMWLPVMDGANKAMKDQPYTYKVKNPKFRYAKKQPDGRYLDSYGNEQPEYFTKSVDAASMMDINKTIMRCLVKNLAMFGLGLYIYAGEDLPETEAADAAEPNTASVSPQVAAQTASVTTASRIPQPEPRAVEKVPEQPETPASYIKRRIKEFQQQDGSFNFINARAALIQGGVVEDVPSATMSMKQAVQLMEAIEKNCVKAS